MITFLAAFLGFALIHSLLASRRLKEAAINRIPAMRYFYRPLYNILAFATLALVWFSYPGSPQTIYWLSPPWSILFHLIQLCGIVLMAFTLKASGTGTFAGTTQLRHFFKNQPPGYDLDESVDPAPSVSGPYRFVRHPLYTAGAIVLLFHPYMTTKWLALTVGSLIYFYIGSRYEEKRLIDKFGESYLTYRKNVPAFLPKARSLKSFSDAV